MEKTPLQGIGVAIITYNRPEYYKKVLKTIPRHRINSLLVVNDGENSYVDEKDADFVIKHNAKLGVAVSKNHALHFLIEKMKCEHLFLIEDDILVLDENVFDEYIKAANSTGIHHLCYEKVNGNEKTLKFTQEQPDGVKIGFYHNPQGAFMYMNANLIKKLGYFDENYINAFEHVDFEYNLVKNGVAPLFWYFPDLLESDKFLKEIEGSSENSSITDKEGYKKNVEISARHFTEKWGHFTNSIKDEGQIPLLHSLIHLQANYSRKKLINKDKRLAIIIPYRDRRTSLENLLPNLRKYVEKQVKHFDIYVVEQNDTKLFNKGLLNNIGYILNPNYDYYCFHDVDLIPEISDYSYPTRPIHLSSHCSQFNYINIPDKIMGGVILFTKEHFKLTNGYPNDYIGWGGEDNNLYARCEKVNIPPLKHSFGKYFSIPHEHRLFNPKEKEKHLENGKKTNDFIAGITNLQDNGLSTINLNNFEIQKANLNDFFHIKIKSKI
jgi:GT2 family glycosyltransferase